MSPIQCYACKKMLSCKRSLRRHKQLLHKDLCTTSSFSCDECGYSCSKLSGIETHMKIQHETGGFRYCLYCHKCFLDTIKYTDHLNNYHGLPDTKLDLTMADTMSGIHPKERAFNGAFKSYAIDVGAGEIDLLSVMRAKRSEFDNIVRLNTQLEPKKVQLGAEVLLTKPTNDKSLNSAPEGITIYLNSKMIVADFAGLSDEQYNEMVEQMLVSLNNFASYGSGWSVQQIAVIDVRLAKAKAVRGSSYLALPTALVGSQHILNIRNQNDENCFLYCYTAQYHNLFGPNLIPDDASWRQVTSPEHYSSNNPLAKQPIGEYDMPMGFHQMGKFEKLNNVRVNVFRFDTKLIPLRVSNHSNYEFDLDLLLISDGAMHHYALIRNLKALLHKSKNAQPRLDSHVCRRCFHVCTSTERYERHQESCQENPPVAIKMPTPDKNSFQFTKNQARWFTPIVGFFDLESIIEPVHGAQNNPQVADSRAIEMHKPCSYSILFLGQGLESPYHFNLRRGPGIMAEFVKELEELAHRIYADKQRRPTFTGQAPISKEDVSDCWICGEKLTDDVKNPTVLDHCHFTGEFLGWAHNKCNLSRRKTNFTPVFAHNLSNYDLHHVILALQNADPRSIISVVPNTEEKLISLQLGVLVASKPDQKGILRNQYEYIRLLDSFRFMNTSLENLVNNLPNCEFTLLENHFQNWPKSSVDKLKEKGCFPYGYIDNFDKLEETRLPALYHWKNSLDRFEINITMSDYDRAHDVFEEFNCKTIGDYYDLYLTTDVFLLATVMMCFRRVCYETYGLDCCQYYTASNLSGDAMLKTCKPNLKLLTERDHLEMTENLMRGGISCVYSERLCSANNKDVSGFKSDEDSTYIVMIDANNLYGGVMEKYPLPLGDFESFENTWDEKAEKELIELVLNTPVDSETGYILEVDLEYPEELHDLHADFPLAPEKLKIEKEWISDYQCELLQQMEIKKPSRIKKLVQTMFAKKNYTLHYLTLKLYVELGMVVTKLHRALSFTQSYWLAPYVKLNTEKRKNANTKFDEDFFKLMVNSSFGKTCEGKRNRIKVKLARSEEEALKATEKPEFKSFRILDNNLVSIVLNETEILWDKPTIVGACILDLAKHFMYQFHYQHMKPNFDCTLLYSDTDSFVYKIRSNDFYDELANNKNLLQQFDFSNFPREHRMFNKDNARVTLKFKDEMAGTFIAEFIGLKPKLYSIQLYSGNAFKVEDEMAGTEIGEFIGLRAMLYSIPQPSGKMLSKIFKFRKKRVNCDMI